MLDPAYCIIHNERWAVETKRYDPFAGSATMRTFKLILLSFPALVFVGCSDRLSRGTEVLLNHQAAVALTVENIQKGRDPSNVADGTKVRIVKDESSDDSTSRKVTILVLEGAHRDQNYDIERYHLEK